MEQNTMARIQRESLGMTQKQIADEARVSAATVSKFENGEEVSEVVRLAILHSITSIKDRLYPDKTYERSCYMLKLYIALFCASETFNDKMRFLNKIIRNVTYIQEYVLSEQRQSNRRW